MKVVVVIEFEPDAPNAPAIKVQDFVSGKVNYLKKELTRYSDIQVTVENL